jgi:hypothetical protein
MDAVMFSILEREIAADCAVILDAAGRAQLRLTETTDGHLEACAYELSRLYNVFEKTLQRICRAFENHFDKQGDYHERLVHRLALDLPGIRPALVPKDGVRAVRELKGFRHVVRHAYDLEFREPRMRELATLASDLAGQVPRWTADFRSRIKAEQGWG